MLVRSHCVCSCRWQRSNIRSGSCPQHPILLRSCPSSLSSSFFLSVSPRRSTLLHVFRSLQTCSAARYISIESVWPNTPRLCVCTWIASKQFWPSGPPSPTVDNVFQTRLRRRKTEGLGLLHDPGRIIRGYSAESRNAPWPRQTLRTHRYRHVSADEGQREEGEEEEGRGGAGQKGRQKGMRDAPMEKNARTSKCQFSLSKTMFTINPGFHLT